MRYVALVLGFLFLFVLNAQGKVRQLLFTRAARGEAFAQHQMGLSYLDPAEGPVDLAKSINYFTLATQQGYAPAQLDLANLYITGDMLPRNKVEGMRLLRLAAFNGSAEAQMQLARLYDSEVEPDEALEGLLEPSLEESARFYKMAADQGFAPAQVTLAMIYIAGRGVKQDAQRGLELMKKAASQGHCAAKMWLAMQKKEGNK